MHELSVMMEVIRIVEELSEEKDIKRVQSIVLEVGELSAVVPDFMIEFFPIVVADKPLFKDARLDFVVIPGRGICDGCGKPYEVGKNKGIYPYCGSKEKTLISGQEFNIREVVVRDESQFQGYHIWQRSIAQGLKHLHNA